MFNLLKIKRFFYKYEINYFRKNNIWPLSNHCYS